MAYYSYNETGAPADSHSHIHGFTLLEIVVSMLILGLVVSGVFALFVSSSKFISQARYRLQALNYARMVTEHLDAYVSAANTLPAPSNAGTGTGCALSSGVHNPSELGIASPLILDGISYNGNYEVINDIDGTDLEQVTVTVNWTEP